MQRIVVLLRRWSKPHRAAVLLRRRSSADQIDTREKKSPRPDSGRGDPVEEG